MGNREVPNRNTKQIGFWKSGEHLSQTQPGIAQKIAQIAWNYEFQNRGHVPKSVHVVLSGNTLVVTFHGALTLAELVLVQTRQGAEQIQEFQQSLFAGSAQEMLREMEKATEDFAEGVVTASPFSAGALIKVFETGTIIQVFLLSKNFPTDSWSGSPDVKTN